MTYTEDSNFDPNFNNKKGVWIGFVGDETPNGINWHWDHTESLTTYTNWAAGEPTAPGIRTCTYVS